METSISVGQGLIKGSANLSKQASGLLLVGFGTTILIVGVLMYYKVV